MVWFTLGETMWYMAVLPALESVVCRDLYMHIKPSSSTMGDPCKVEEVQVRLSSLHGWLDQFTLVGGADLRHFMQLAAKMNGAGLATGLPYALLAKRIGKKTVLVISLTGTTLAMCWFFYICKKA
jgi:hypothetical protein